ncbi:glycosyltransferase family 9 protein [bacterium]|nr:glycosyltransferase family 9 protein [bacterium]
MSLPPFKNILLRAPNWIGDHVLAADFYAGLRAAFPTTQITLVCSAGMEALLPDDWFDEVEIAPARRGLKAWRFWWSLRARRFDLALQLPSSLRSASQLWLTRAPVRVGYADAGAGFLLSRSRPWQGRASGKHKAALYRELLELVLGSSAPERKPDRSTGDGPIVIAPGASIRLREWPGFAELIPALRKAYPEKEIRIVGNQDHTLWEHRVQTWNDPAVENWIGLTDLPDLAELCAEASLVIANDSGVAHIAASLAGAPTVVLFGPGDPVYVMPRGNAVAVTPRALDCAPCESARCRAPHGYQACLRSISVQDVLSKLPALR